MKRIATSMLIIFTMMVATFAPSTTIYATDSNDTAMLDGKVIEGMTQEELDEESVMGQWAFDEYADGDSVSENSSIMLFSSSKAWSQKSDGTFLNGDGTKVLTGALCKGIDVSKHQGTIDWSKVKNSDVSFAIIRVGYGSDETSQDDAKFAYNVQQCEKYGIPYGFYLYSYANTLTKNKSEIQHVLRLIKGTKPTYPVYYDLEDGDTTGKCAASTIQTYALNYCTAIKAAGYTPGIYASLYWWRNKLGTTKLDPYEKWVAQYNTSVAGCSYTGANCGIWQCASNYYTSGLSGRVDLNFAYKKYGKGTTSTASSATTTTTTTTAPATAESSTTATSDSTTETTASDAPGWVTKSGKTYYYYAKDKKYTSTYKKIDNFYYGFDSKGAIYKSTTKKISKKTYTFDKKGRAYLCKVKTTAKIYYRTGAGKSYKAKGLFKKGKSLNIIRKNGDWWYTTGGYWVNKNYLKVTKKYPY